MIIAVDFDGTVVQNRYPDMGPPVPHALTSLLKLVAQGHEIILFTMRGGQPLQDAIDYLEAGGIPLLGVNSNPTQHWWTNSPKAYANLYIDDSALGCPLFQPDGDLPPYVYWPRIMALISERYDSNVAH